MGSLGECLYFESRWNEAEPLLRHALMIKHQLHDDSDSGIENFLALVLERKGDYQEAAELLRQALEISRRTQGTDGPDYVVALHNLAGTLIDAGDLSGAETMERQSLDLRRRILGEWHPEVYYSLNNLGWILLQKGEWQNAEPFLRDNLILVRKNFGDNNSKHAVALKNWGLELEERSDYVRAEKAFKSALDVSTRVSGEKSWYVARILASLGQLEFDRRQYDKAESYARQALDLSRQLGGDDSPDVANLWLCQTLSFHFERGTRRTQCWRNGSYVGKDYELDAITGAGRGCYNNITCCGEAWGGHGDGRCTPHGIRSGHSIERHSSG